MYEEAERLGGKATVDAGSTMDPADILNALRELRLA